MLERTNDLGYRDIARKKILQGENQGRSTLFSSSPSLQSSIDQTLLKAKSQRSPVDTWS